MLPIHRLFIDSWYVLAVKIPYSGIISAILPSPKTPRTFTFRGRAVDKEVGSSPGRVDLIADDAVFDAPEEDDPVHASMRQRENEQVLRRADMPDDRIE